MVQPKVETESPKKRSTNFSEVSLGYSKKIATDEAQRCPQCLDPVCMRGCPLGINIPGFIRALREGNIALALDKIKEQNPLPSICGRICSAPCEISCILTNEHAPIGIRALERYASDNGKPRQRTQTVPQSQLKKVAIVGSGPTGMTAASQLAKKGFSVTVFEALDKPGGVLRYGIPEFRLPNKILDQEITELRSLGVDIQTNFFIGKTKSIDDLKAQGFKAILLACGAGAPKFMDIPGANLGGVYYGEEFLMRVNLSRSNMFSQYKPNFTVGKKVVVLGAGNTALDCARSALRFGAQVTLASRRSEDEMFIRKEERDLAREEGIVFEPLTQPLEIIADSNDFADGVKCVRLDYTDSDSKEGWTLEAVPDSGFIMEADMVVIAVGHQPNSLVCKFDKRIELDSDGTIHADEDTGLTSLDGVFAAGNVVTNAGPVVEAIAAGKKIAEQIDQYLQTL